MKQELIGQAFGRYHLFSADENVKILKTGIPAVSHSGKLIHPSKYKITHDQT